MLTGTKNCMSVTDTGPSQKQNSWRRRGTYTCGGQLILVCYLPKLALHLSPNLKGMFIGQCAMVGCEHVQGTVLDILCKLRLLCNHAYFIWGTTNEVPNSTMHILILLSVCIHNL